MICSVASCLQISLCNLIFFSSFPRTRGGGTFKMAVVDGDSPGPGASHFDDTIVSQHPANGPKWKATPSGRGCTSLRCTLWLMAEIEILLSVRLKKIFGRDKKIAAAFPPGLREEIVDSSEGEAYLSMTDVLLSLLAVCCLSTAHQRRDFRSIRSRQGPTSRWRATSCCVVL